MEVLLELLLEVILTPILTAYADLAETVFGGRKLGKRLEYFLRILCGIVFTVALLLVLAGILLLSDEEAEGAGKGMLIVGGCILLVHVLIGIVAKICRPSEKEEGNGEEGGRGGAARRGNGGAGAAAVGLSHDAGRGEGGIVRFFCAGGKRERGKGRERRRRME